MSVIISELEEFYESDIGVIAQKILQDHIGDLWSSVSGLRVLGCGYANPYLDVFSDDAERIISMMPAEQGSVPYTRHEKNLAFSSSYDSMPIENSSVDRVILVHYLEHSQDLRSTIREIWRVLKGNGRLIVIVPNRNGMWSRADFTPFGHGMPFTSHQLCMRFKDNLFAHEKCKGALFVPPIPNSLVMMRSANLIEKMGGRVLPFVAGVHVMEFSKQIYATIDKGGTGSAVLAKTKKILQGKVMPIPQGFEPVKDSNLLD